MAKTYFKVVRIVRGGNFNSARAEFQINVTICNNGDFLIDKGKNKHFAYVVLVSFIFRINCHRGIAKHSFRTGGSNGYVTTTILKGIAQVPEE